MDVKQTERSLERESELLSAIRREIERVVVGQTYLVERLVAGLLCNIHVLIAFSAIRNNDRVGLIVFTDTLELFIPPLKVQRHAQCIVRELLAARPQSSGTDIAGALEFLRSVQKRRAVVFVLSDFITPGYERMLSIFSRRERERRLHR